MGCNETAIKIKRIRLKWSEWLVINEYKAHAVVQLMYLYTCYYQLWIEYNLKAKSDLQTIYGLNSIPDICERQNGVQTWLLALLRSESWVNVSAAFGFDGVASWSYANEQTTETFSNSPQNMIIIQKVKILLEICAWVGRSSHAMPKLDSIIPGHRMDEHVQRNLRHKYDQFLLFIRTFASYYSRPCKEEIRRAERQYAKYQNLAYHVAFTLSLLHTHTYVEAGGVKWINENKISRNGCSQYCVCSAAKSLRTCVCVCVCSKLHISVAHDAGMSNIFTVVGC